MRPLLLIAGSGLFLLAGRAPAALPNTGSSGSGTGAGGAAARGTTAVVPAGTGSTAAAAGGTGATSAAGTAAAAGRTATGTGTGSSANGAGLSRSNLLCAGLLGSGVLGNVLTVAPMTAANSDPNTAIQFTKIWSDTHQATVGGPPPAAVPHTKPMVATVKLPIAFSAAERQQFEQAGWKLRPESGGHGAYCLENAGRPEGGGAPTPGMICVTAGH